MNAHEDDYTDERYNLDVAREAHDGLYAVGCLDNSDGTEASDTLVFLGGVVLHLTRRLGEVADEACLKWRAERREIGLDLISALGEGVTADAERRELRAEVAALKLATDGDIARLANAAKLARELRSNIEKLKQENMRLADLYREALASEGRASLKLEASEAALAAEKTKHPDTPEDKDERKLTFGDRVRITTNGPFQHCLGTVVQWGYAFIMVHPDGLRREDAMAFERRDLKYIPDRQASPVKAPVPRKMFNIGDRVSWVGSHPFLYETVLCKGTVIATSVRRDDPNHEQTLEVRADHGAKLENLSAEKATLLVPEPARPLAVGDRVRVTRRQSSLYAQEFTIAKLERAEVLVESPTGLGWFTAAELERISSGGGEK